MKRHKSKYFINYELCGKYELPLLLSMEHVKYYYMIYQVGVEGSF